MTHQAESTAPSPLSYAGKSVLITGAGSGIGLALVEAFARAGAQVVACDYSPTASQAIAESLAPLGLSAHFVKADIREDRDVSAMMEAIAGNFGIAVLDIAVNNAGIVGPREALDQSAMDVPGGILDTINTNLLGTMRCVREQLKIMRPQGYGIIINIASVYGSRGAPNAAIYTATKHGIIGLTRTIAHMESGNGIRTLSISPGGVDTPLLRRTLGDRFEPIQRLLPMGRFANPADIADAVLAAAHPSPLFVNGVDIKVDGATIPH